MSNYGTSIAKYTSKDGKEKYRVHYSFISPTDGKRHRTCKRGFIKKSDAQEWIQNDLAKTVRKLEQKQKISEFLTMPELVEEYLEYAKLNKGVQETTMENKLFCINKHILPYFNDFVVFDITPKHIKDWQIELKKHKKPNGKPYAETYLRTVENQLSAIFNYAVRYYELPRNPIVERIGSKETTDEMKIWEVDMYREFQKHIEDKPIYYYAFEVFFWCGVRLGELLAITPSDIDFTKKTLNIDKSMRYINGKLVVGPPKTPSSYRKITLPDFLIDELKEYLDSIEHYSKNSRIFPLNKSKIGNVIDKYSELAGVPRITIHGLRHSHTSLLEQIGISSVSIKQRLGHKRKKSGDITTTYTHTYASSSVMTAKILNEVAIGNIDPNNPFGNLISNNKEV